MQSDSITPFSLLNFLLRVVAAATIHDTNWDLGSMRLLACFLLRNGRWHLHLHGGLRRDCEAQTARAERQQCQGYVSLIDSTGGRKEDPGRRGTSLQRDKVVRRKSFGSSMTLQTLERQGKGDTWAESNVRSPHEHTQTSDFPSAGSRTEEEPRDAFPNSGDVAMFWPYITQIATKVHKLAALVLVVAIIV